MHMGNADSSVIVQVPEKGWDVLSETLDLDSQSSVFPPSLRELIGLALKSVKVVSRKKTRKTWHLELLIPGGAWDLMQETLGMDMTSTWFDKDLQHQIRMAWGQVDVRNISPKDWSPLWSSR